MVGMNGYHVFYQSKDNDDKFEEINYLIQIASILFWKKNEGKMILYCNSKYLDFIKKWGIDTLYDEINTECLDNILYKEYLNKYWSFCKIEAAFDISKKDSDFVIIDTDLWIHEPVTIDSSLQFIGYHPEQKLDHPENPYIDPNNFMNKEDLQNFDWSIIPINCAFLYLNSKELVSEWYTLSCDYHNIDDTPSILPNLENFKEHRHDQSIFSLLTKKYNMFSSRDLSNSVYIIRNRSGESKIGISNI
jgi:hypothetical protein